MRTLLRRGLILAAAVALCCAVASAQRGRYGRNDDRSDYDRGRRDDNRRGPYARARDLLSRTMRDLRIAERQSRPRGREQERFDNAQRHLSQMDEHLSRGVFDKDILDSVIEDVHNVVRNNTLPPRMRDALSDDLRDLRGMRAARGNM